MVLSVMHGIRCSQYPVPCHINTVLGDAERYPNLPDQPKARIYAGFRAFIAR